jgi:hypothetical protein
VAPAFSLSYPIPAARTEYHAGTCVIFRWERRLIQEELRYAHRTGFSGGFPVIGRVACARRRGPRAPAGGSPSLSEDQIRDLFRQAADADLKNDKKQRDYTYTEREVMRTLDGKGRVKSTESKTYEVMELYGSEVHRLVAKDDKALSGDAARKEEERIQKVVARRTNEDEKEREKREERERETARRGPSVCARGGGRLQLPPDGRRIARRA